MSLLKNCLVSFRKATKLKSKSKKTSLNKKRFKNARNNNNYTTSSMKLKNRKLLQKFQSWQKVKLFEDLAKIKAQNKEKDENIANSKNLGKAEQKEIDKLMKEKDRLEMKAMVLRMQERDKASTKNIVSGNSKSEMTDDQIQKLIPEMRKKARDKYIKDREETQMNLYKKILDDQTSMFEKKDSRVSLVDKLINQIQGGGTELTDIEKRQLEIDKKLYDLANKHRKTYSKDALDDTAYKMPDVYDENDGKG